MLTILILFSAVSVITRPVYTAYDVNFRVFNQSKAEVFQICRSDNIASCNVNVSLPFKFLIHGYLNNPKTKWLIDAKNEYLNKGPYNVIIVDWSKSTYFFNYFISARRTKVVGNVIGEFICKLHIEKLMSFNKIHLIGHSLGAHVSGLAGKYINLFCNASIGRVTGLDPANIPFSEYPATKRLFHTDANFVDVIHSDDYGFGYKQTDLAIANFFPNGGEHLQPGCYSKKRKRDLSLNGLFRILFTCSHNRAPEFFVESINSKRFIANKCENYSNYLSKKCSSNPVATMGENIDTNTSGNYYLQTNAERPYAKGA